MTQVSKHEKVGTIRFGNRNHTPSWKVFGEGGSNSFFRVSGKFLEFHVNEYSIPKAPKRVVEKSAYTSITREEAIELRNLLNEYLKD